MNFCIDASLENVAQVGHAVNSFCQQHGLQQSDGDIVELCAVEAINNAIKHAYLEHPKGQVEITISLVNDQIELSVSDRGESMKTVLAPHLDFDPENIEALPEGGMGLLIIHGLMDHVTYVARDGRNTLTMYKRLS